MTMHIDSNEFTQDGFHIQSGDFSETQHFLPDALSDGANNSHVYLMSFCLSMPYSSFKCATDSCDYKHTSSNNQYYTFSIHPI